MSFSTMCKEACAFVQISQLRFTGSLEMDRVNAVFREALDSFMSKRKSPLTTQMFTDLFNRFPVSTELGS